MTITTHSQPNVRRLWQRFLPLEVLPRKLRLRLLRDVLGRESLRSPVLDFHMEMPLRFPALTNALTLYRHRELDHLEILRSALKPGDHVLEIGGNIGYYAVITGRLVGDDGHVTVYEPDPRNIDFIQRNITLNGLKNRITVNAKAISDSEGNFEFQIAEASNLNSVRRTEASNVSNYADRKYAGSISVQVDELGKVLENAVKPITLMRMDVEGHEVEIFSALASYLDRHGRNRAPRAIVFEPHSWEYAKGPGIANSLDTFRKHGYRITHLGSRDERKAPMHDFGWRPTKTVRELRGVTRGIYENLPQDDAARLASSVDGVTTVCLQY
jgi:FkbM family methyltransferase